MSRAWPKSAVPPLVSEDQEDEEHLVAHGGDDEEVDREEFMEVVGRLPEIREVHRVTGSETYLLRVLVPSVQDLERILRPLWKYGDTVTGVVTSTAVDGRPISRVMVR